MAYLLGGSMASGHRDGAKYGYREEQLNCKSTSSFAGGRRNHEFGRTSDIRVRRRMERSTEAAAPIAGQNMEVKFIWIVGTDYGLQ